MKCEVQTNQADVQSILKEDMANQQWKEQSLQSWASGEGVVQAPLSLPPLLVQLQLSLSP